MVVLFSPVYTAVTWQWVYMPHKNARLKKDKLDGAFSMHGRDEKYYSRRSLKVRKQMRNLGVDGRLTLNGFLDRYSVRMLIGET
jgi:hypothetical protein